MKVAITTRNRPDSFNACYRSVLKFVPDSDIIVVDDASDCNYSNADYVFKDRVGIPRAKNKCIEIFMQSDSEHLFMLDDDVIIKDGKFFDEYINSGVNHLCYTFLQHYRSYDKFKIHALGNGCAMYFNRVCFDTVGGFDTEYGIGKYEHVDLYRRINNAGLTPYRFIDLVGSSEWIYSLDQHHEISRSFTPNEIAEQLQDGLNYFRKNEKSVAFKDYK